MDATNAIASESDYTSSLLTTEPLESISAVVLSAQPVSSKKEMTACVVAIDKHLIQ